MKFFDSSNLKIQVIVTEEEKKKRAENYDHYLAPDDAMREAYINGYLTGNDILEKVFKEFERKEYGNRKYTFGDKIFFSVILICFFLSFPWLTYSVISMPEYVPPQMVISERFLVIAFVFPYFYMWYRGIKKIIERLRGIKQTTKS